MNVRCALWICAWLAVVFGARAGSFSTVVIDAGHGGHDFGGIRQNIIPEKGVALDVALRLQNALRKAGFNTVMTRSTDVFVPLDRRVAIANSQRNAIFVSIHFNSATRRGARGIETFSCSDRGAVLARMIQSRAMTTTDGVNRGCKNATFYVLRKTKTTAVLIECGFLTNPDDTALARSANYRERLAQQIAQGILAYRKAR